MFGAEASVHHSSTSVGPEAKVVMAGGSVSIFDLQLALGLLSEAGIVDDSLSLKLAGKGIKTGRKVEICTLDVCFGVDFGRIFG